MAPTASASLLVKSNFGLADRIKIQQESCRKRDYIIIGHLLSIHWEAQRNISGLSQSRPRWANSKQGEESARMGVPDAMHPFSEVQMRLWASTTLDWLSDKKAPILAISRDQKDLLFPLGMAPLPAIPNPLWTAEHSYVSCQQKDGCSGCIAPRIPQALTGCPIVGDRVTDKIKARDGHEFGVIHPIAVMCVMLGGAQGGFAKIRGAVEPSDGTHLAMLLDDTDPENMRAYFVGGRFILGG